LAGTGELSQPAVLTAQLARMLDDPRSQAFVESFASQWLGEDDLLRHPVEPTTFPEWDETLRASMAREMLLYFDAFLRTDRPFDGFVDTDINFVDARLARHYGMDATGLADTSVRVADTNDHRQGFMGLAGFLTATSLSYKTDPPTRGLRVLEWLLCEWP